MQRQYKMDLPLNTVNRIRSKFGELGIHTYEKYWKNVNNQLFSCAVSIENSNVMRTLGKGTDSSYCLASGYGELMERIENLILLSGSVGMSYLDILKNWPDVVEVKNRAQLHELNNNECMDSVNRVCDELLMEPVEDFPNTIYAAKFFSVKDNRVLYMPYSELYRSLRSNGMCAGNAPEEAMVEGLCEIMERMAIKSIFLDGVVPPAVPDEVLKRYPAYAIIEDARSKGLKVEIRDCSLGKGLPVLGILTINERSGLYKYNFGSHPDFEHAIERCLTEICQVSGGVNSVDEFLEGGMELSFSEDSFVKIPGRDEEFNRRSRFYKALKNSNGELPVEYFTGKSSYEFREWTAFEGNSDYKQDVKTICELIEKDGEQVFARDVSFLGFPAYEMFVTGYSTVMVDQNFSDYKEYVANRRSNKNEIMMLSRLNRCSEEEKLDLVDFLELQMNSPKFFNAEANNNWMCEVMGVPVTAPDTKCPQFVLALVEMSLSRYSEAYKHFMYAYERGYYPKGEHRYYEILKVYLELKSLGTEDEEIKRILGRYFSEDLANRVMEDILSGKIYRKADILPYVNSDELKLTTEVYKKVIAVVQNSNIDMNNLI
ncbi:MAG: YcaO-like family protein [Roseburia sp.]